MEITHTTVSRESHLTGSVSSLAVSSRFASLNNKGVASGRGLDGVYAQINLFPCHIKGNVISRLGRTIKCLSSIPFSFPAGEG